MKLKKHIVLLLLILLGIGAAVGILAERVEREENNRTYDIVMDYDSMVEMAEASEESVDFWLEHFASLGVDKLGLWEDTLSSLANKCDGVLFAKYVTGIRSGYGWEEDYPQEVVERLKESEKKKDLLVSCTDEKLFARVLDALQRRCDVVPEVFYGENGHGYLFLTGEGKKVSGESYLSLPLGVDPELIAKAEKYGYTVVPRTKPVEGLNGITFLGDVLKEYKTLGVPYIIGGGTTPGADEKQQAIAMWISHMKDTGSVLGVVEKSEQSLNMVYDGLEQTVTDSGDNAVRVFSTWNYIQWRYGWYGYEGSEEIVSCFYRAVYERSCRVIYLKMMMRELGEDKLEYITDPEAYTVMMADLTSRLAQRGYSHETVKSLGQITVGLPMLILVAVGAVAAAVLLLELVFPLKKKWLYGLLALGCVCAAGALYVMPNTGRLILSMGGGIVMPLLAVALIMNRLNRAGEKKLRDYVLLLVGAALISLVGGLFASAPLSDTSYMLEMKLYRGVKIMQLVPLAGFLCLFLKDMFWEKLRGGLLAVEARERREKLEAVMETTVKVKYVAIALIVLILGAVVLVVGKYYLARTGHSDGASTASFEIAFRNFLENHLAARPRTKEFLIGYPCVVLYIWCRRKDSPVLTWLSVLPGLGAVIGLTSIVNTFLHIRTIFCLSLVRVLTGFAFGIVVAAIALLIAEGIYRLIKKRMLHV